MAWQRLSSAIEEQLRLTCVLLMEGIMFGSNVLEIVIGLIFIYVLLSLFCTTVTELIARFFALRSLTLEEGIKNMLAGSGEGKEIAEAFYCHPLISKMGLRDKGLLPQNKKGMPSYLSSNYFALALYDTLFPGDPEMGPITVKNVRETISTFPEEVKRPLLALLDEANNDLTNFRKGIENWFDELMQRIDGWYRRKTQVITIIVAIIVSVIFNADTIMMANSLHNNATLRNAVVAAAGQLDADNEETTVNLSELQSELLGTGIIGWLPVSDEYDDPREYPASPGNFAFKSIGLLLTAGLVSLGAPFWFDILNKVSNIRATGTPPKNTEGKENGIVT